MDPVLNLNAARVIHVADPSLGMEEELAVAQTLRSSWISQGPKTAEFEREFASFHGVTHGVACCSGTSALQLALAALRIKDGDEVICPTLTMVAVANAIRYVGATPVFVDSEGVGNMDYHAVRAAMTGRTRAIIAPHLYGKPIDWLRNSAGIHDPPVIEDCAESHFARYSNGKLVGTVGRIACFSFYSNKIIAAGEAGMSITSDHDLAIRMRQLRSHAFTPGNHFHHQELAYGMRTTDMSSAVGLVQLSRWKSIADFRRSLRVAYHDLLSKVGSIELWPIDDGDAHWVMPLTVKDGVKFTRDDMRHYLADRGIETRTFFVPMSSQPHLRQFAVGKSFPVAESLAQRGLYLPLHCHMSLDSLNYVCENIRAFCS
jgi:perosamine synthetase